MSKLLLVGIALIETVVSTANQLLLIFLKATFYGLHLDSCLLAPNQSMTLRVQPFTHASCACSQTSQGLLHPPECHWATNKLATGIHLLLSTAQGSRCCYVAFPPRVPWPTLLFFKSCPEQVHHRLLGEMDRAGPAVHVPHPFDAVILHVLGILHLKTEQKLNNAQLTLGC